MPSTKSPPVKAAVIAKHLSGESNVQIAKQLGVSRPTVIRILDEAEIDSLTLQARSVIHSAMPEIATCVANHARKNVTTALEVMDRTGFLPKRVAVSSGVNVGMNLSLSENSLNLTSHTEEKQIEAQPEPEMQLDSGTPVTV